MGRRQINHEQTVARLPAGTLARIERVLKEGEPLAEFMRAAVARELNRRERAAAKK